MTKLLELQSVTVALPAGSDRAQALSEVSLGLHPNEIVCVVGESGSGKSMTASAIMGLLPSRVRVTAGRVLLEGVDLLRLDEQAMREVRGRRIGMVFQDPMTGLHPQLRVGEQIEEVMLVHRWGDRLARRRRALDALAAVGLPDPELIHRTYPFRLSGGQRQRVMIAIAAVLRPEVLIADEPTSSLDVTSQMLILRLIRKLQSEQGMGVLFITHDFGVVAEIADRVAVMQQGRVVEFGATGDVLRHPRHPYTRALIDAVRLQTRGTGRGPAVGAEPVLQIRAVTKVYQRGAGLLRRGRRVAALDGVRLDLVAGETLGVVGESGSGKSTLARCVIRLIEPTSGSIRLRGTELGALPRARMRTLRASMQMIFQDPYASLNPRQRAVDLVADGPAAHGVSREAARQRARELLGLVGLGAAAAERFPHEFSGGQRQRIGIARALALRPEVLICDEPVSALDVSVQAQVLDLLASIRQQFGLTTMFITHDLRVAAQICDRIAVMQAGRVVEVGQTADVIERPQHSYTRELMAAVPGRWAYSALAEPQSPECA